MKTYWIVLPDCTSFKKHQAIFIKGAPNPGPQDRLLLVIMHFSFNCNKFLECTYSFGVFIFQMRVGFQIYVLFFDNHQVTAYDGVADATWRMIVY